MDGLPTELLTLVLKELDQITVWALRRVCKRWNEVLTDENVQRKIIVDYSSLSHLRAVRTGMPQGYYELPVTGRVVGIEGHEVIVNDSHHVDMLDLRTGVLRETGKLWVCESIVDVVRVDRHDLLGITSFRGKTCVWRTDGIYLDGLTPFACPHYTSRRILMDEGFVYLLGFGGPLTVYRFRRPGMTMERFKFDYDKFNPSIIPTGDGYLLTADGTFLLTLGEMMRLVEIKSSELKAVWKGVAYTAPLVARAITREKRVCKMGRLEEWYPVVVVNDHYLVGWNRGFVMVYPFEGAGGSGFSLEDAESIVLEETEPVGEREYLPGPKP